jgi:hypothetical protein
MAMEDVALVQLASRSFPNGSHLEYHGYFAVSSWIFSNYFPLFIFIGAELISIKNIDVILK